MVRSQAGFTLMEILVAILLFVVVIGGVTALQVSGLRTNKSTVQIQDAVAITRDYVERLRSVPKSIPTLCTTGLSMQQGSDSKYTVNCSSVQCRVEPPSQGDLNGILNSGKNAGQTCNVDPTKIKVNAYQLKISVYAANDTSKNPIFAMQTLIFDPNAT